MHFPSAPLFSQQQVTALSFITVVIIITELDKRQNTETVTQSITAVIRHFTVTNTEHTLTFILHQVKQVCCFSYFSNNQKPLGHKFTLKGQFTSKSQQYISLPTWNVLHPSGCWSCRLMNFGDFSREDVHLLITVHGAKNAKIKSLYRNIRPCLSR